MCLVNLRDSKQEAVLSVHIRGLFPWKLLDWDQSFAVTSVFNHPGTMFLGSESLGPAETWFVGRLHALRWNGLCDDLTQRRCRERILTGARLSHMHPDSWVLKTSSGHKTTVAHPWFLFDRMTSSPRGSHYPRGQVLCTSEEQKLELPTSSPSLTWTFLP